MGQIHQNKKTILAAAGLSVVLLFTMSPVSAFSPANSNTIPALGTLAAGQQVVQRFDSAGNTWVYYMYLPPTYNDAGNSSRKWPVILHLTTAGACYDWSGSTFAGIVDDRGQYSWSNGGVAHLLSKGASTCKYFSDSFIVMVPWLSYQDLNPCNANTPQYNAFFPPLLRHVKSTLQIDTMRINLTGYCFGGAVAYKYATIFPGTISSFSMWSVNSTSAQAPACCDVSKVCSLKNIAMRQYAGTGDSYVPYASGQALSTAIQACNPVNYVWTAVPCGHECWSTYNACTDTVKALYDWMLPTRANVSGPSAINQGARAGHPADASTAGAVLNTRIAKGASIDIIGLNGQFAAAYAGTGLRAAQMLAGLKQGAYVIRLSTGTTNARCKYLAK
jgi:predicted peptidase